MTQEKVITNGFDVAVLDENYLNIQKKKNDKNFELKVYVFSQDELDELKSHVGSAKESTSSGLSGIYRALKRLMKMA